MDFTFIYEELKGKYCLDNGRNAIPPIRMFNYLLLKSIFDHQAVYQIDASMKGKFPSKDESDDIQEELIYCEKVISTIENEPNIAGIPAVREKLNVLKEVVEDYAEHLSYSTDPDARVGHNTADSAFFGYKTHIAMND